MRTKVEAPQMTGLKHLAQTNRIRYGNHGYLCAKAPADVQKSNDGQCWAVASLASLSKPVLQLQQPAAKVERDAHACRQIITTALHH